MKQYKRKEQEGIDKIKLDLEKAFSQLKIKKREKSDIQTQNGLLLYEKDSFRLIVFFPFLCDATHQHVKDMGKKNGENKLIRKLQLKQA